VGRPKKPQEDKAETSPSFSMKSSAEWMAWVEELAKHLNMTKAEAVDEGLLLLARQRGFSKMPPPRFKSR
jgi:hypothetical protein